MHNYSFPLFLNSARASHSPRQRFSDANTPFIRISRICLKVSYIHSIMIRTGFSRHAGKAFRDCGKAFSRWRKDVFRHAGMVFWKAGKGFSAQHKRLKHRRNESACAFYTVFSAFAFPVSRFCFVKIFYCQNRIFMHSGMHRACAIPSLPAQWRMPSRDAKSCVSRAKNSAMTGT